MLTIIVNTWYVEHNLFTSFDRDCHLLASFWISDDEASIFCRFLRYSYHLDRELPSIEELRKMTEMTRYLLAGINEAPPAQR